MRLFHITPQQVQSLEELPSQLGDEGYFWLSFSRREFELMQQALQTLLRAQGVAVHELHWQNLLSNQLPSHYDYASDYDLMVFRRLAPGRSESDPGAPGTILHRSRGLAGPEILSRIDTSPVSFLLLERCLISVHPADCGIREPFIARLTADTQRNSVPVAAYAPASPAELMLRLIGTMVDSYLGLRRELTRQLDQWQKHLLDPDNRFNDWSGLLDSRMTLHFLDEICEDQRAAIESWLESLENGSARQRLVTLQLEPLKLRSRDVLEHIERVDHHINRLEQSTETTIQLHFNVQGNRTNAIMRTLTVLTAIFLPLNLITGFFGMNFETFDFLHQDNALVLTEIFMVVLVLALIVFFWRKRYLQD